jgi:glycosyltransferase involved in cell wall biosynthesis
MELVNEWVFVSATDNMGGAEQCLQLLAEASGGQFIVLKKATSNQLKLAKNLKVNFLTKGPLLLGLVLLPIALFKYRNNYKIISSNAYINAFIGLLKRIKYLKSDVIVRESTQIFTRFTGIKKASYSLAYSLGYPGVDMVVCQTDQMRDQLISYNRFLNPGNVICVPSPIDVKLIERQIMKNEIVNNGKFICAAGRLIPLKGFHILIRAFKDITENYPDLKLIILGDGPERDKLLSLIKELNLENRVILKGFVNNPFSYFKKAQCCVISSIQEGFPNVLLQMLSTNNAVISTECAGGISEIPGLVTAKTNNIEDLQYGIKSLLKMNTSSHREKFDAYLANRTPAIFLNTILSHEKFNTLVYE